jgi:hypothetical protein
MATSIRLHKAQLDARITKLQKTGPKSFEPRPLKERKIKQIRRKVYDIDVDKENQNDQLNIKMPSFKASNKPNSVS